jgi:hypothetical protein
MIIFKVVCDQAANMKSAFSKIESMVDVIDLTTQLLAKQRQVYKNTQRSEKMHKELLSEIDDINKIEQSASPDKRKKSRDVLLAEWEELSAHTDELSDIEEVDEEECDKTLDDAEDYDEELVLSQKDLAYIPCLAHNIQLVVNDGLELDKTFKDLVNKISTDIVSKTKTSTIIAEELRKFDLKLNKRNAIRWNSTLFMIR